MTIEFRDIIDGLIRKMNPDFDQPSNNRPEKIVVRAWYPGSNAVAELQVTFPKKP